MPFKYVKISFTFNQVVNRKCLSIKSNDSISNIDKRSTIQSTTRAIKEYKKSLKLSGLQIEVLVGILLGSASFKSTLSTPGQPNPEHSNYSLGVLQSSKKEEYVSHLFGIFENFSGTKPIIRNKGRICSFMTYSHPEFKPYFHLFYKFEYNEESGKWKRVKIIPSNLETLLTSRSLAYLCQDSNAYYLENEGYIIPMNEFTLEEVEFFINILSRKWGLQCVIYNKSKLSVCIKPESLDNFIKVIKPYIDPSLIEVIIPTEYSNNELSSSTKSIKSNKTIKSSKSSKSSS